MRATHPNVTKKLIVLAFVLTVLNVQADEADDNSQFVSHHNPSAKLITSPVQIKPFIRGIPDGYIPDGQTEATSVIVWNAGSDYPYCEVYMTVNNGEETELGRGHDGKANITVRRGSTYDFKMVVYLGDRGDDVREIANLTMVGRSRSAGTITLGKRKRPGTTSATEAPSTPGSARFEDKRPGTTSSIMKLPFFYDVRVKPLGDAFDLSFETFENSEFFIEVSKESPVYDLETEIPAGNRLPAAFNPGTRLSAYTLPGMSGVKKQHQATVRSAPGQVFEANAFYHYVITAKTADGSFRRYIGEFTNVARNVRIVFERVKIINDGDPDPPLGTDCGEIDLWFWANYGRPDAQFAILNNINGSHKGACSGGEYKINREFTISNSATTLSLSVSGRDRDTESSAGSDLFGPAQPPPFKGPHDTGDEEQNVAFYEFDLRQIELNTTIPFKLVTPNADGGDQGDLMFEVYGRIIISSPR